MIEYTTETDRQEIRRTGSNTIQYINGRTTTTVTTDETYVLEPHVNRVVCLNDDVDIIMSEVLHLEDFPLVIERPSDPPHHYQVKDGAWKLISPQYNLAPPIRPGFYANVQASGPVTINLPRNHGKSQMIINDLTNGKSITVANSQEQAEKLFKEYKDILRYDYSVSVQFDGQNWNQITT